MSGRRIAAVPLAVALLAVAACSHQSTTADPPAAQFAPGLCRTVAPAVLDIGRVARDAPDVEDRRGHRAAQAGGELGSRRIGGGGLVAASGDGEQGDRQRHGGDSAT